MSSESVTIHLSSDEALVLFELLACFEQDESFAIEHQGETVALWRLEAALERVLAEPFRSDYRGLVSTAREKLAGRKESRSFPHQERRIARPCTRAEGWRVRAELEAFGSLVER